MPVLPVRVVEVLGIDVCLELYKETQRIEADGGMMIKVSSKGCSPEYTNTIPRNRTAYGDVHQAGYSCS